ncbi:hypothetical protein BU17DRAFT_54206 [Hysterangium stoloniferum]|nr:hypothetical protein BU17DRAFT_54206 [Hysterangium stoloniferum]
MLLLAALAHHKGLQPPNPPPTKSDRVKSRSSLFEVTSNALIGTAVTTICPAGPTATEFTTLQATFIAGVTMMFIGGLTRIWCYRALGTLFTFEITIRPNHKLVTWGPYAYLRHPSYTGALFLISGTVLTTLGPNGYAVTCGIMAKSTTIRWLLRSWGVWSFYVIYAVFIRGPVEDAELEKTFGEEWSDYAQRVVYRCIPGIY